MKLLVVESPAKAKTIKGYLGPDFDVVASVGHFRDLPRSGIGIDENQQLPNYLTQLRQKSIQSPLVLH